MPKPKRGSRLGAGPAHQKLMLANQAADLFVHGRIKTTETKAKHLRPYAEKLITKAKRGDLHARRLVLAQLRDRDVVDYLFEEVAPRFSERNGGYTRILKLAPRSGDNAPMALIELVEQAADHRGEDVIDEARAGRMRGLFGRRRRKPEREQMAADRDFDHEEQPEGADRDVEDVLDVETSPETAGDPETVAPPEVDTTPSGADLPAQEDADDAPGDVPPPGRDTQVTDPDREVDPDAGSSTGGGSPT